MFICKEEFLHLTQSLLRAHKFSLPDYAVCVECKMAENGCLLMKGEACLGPVSRGGCDAVCPTFGAVCWGCRGTFPDANFSGHIFAMEDKKVDKETIRRAYRIFNGAEKGGNAGHAL